MYNTITQDEETNSAIKSKMSDIENHSNNSNDEEDEISIQDQDLQNKDDSNKKEQSKVKVNEKSAQTPYSTGYRCIW